MFTHVMVGAHDLAASKKFYDAVLGAIGLPAGQADPKGRIFYRTKTGVFGITKPIDGQPGGSSMLLPPLATPASWKALACSGLAHAKPMVPPLACVAALPSIGLVMPNTPVFVR